MGGGPTQTSSSTTPNVPGLSTTLGNLLTNGPNSVQGIFNKGPQVFNQSLYPGAGANTQQSWADSLAAARNPAYALSVNGALQSFGRAAAGGDYGMNDPGYAALRQNVADTTMRDINNSFNSAGLFGSDSNMRAAGQGVGTALANLDYGNFQNDRAWQQQAAQLLPSLFQAGQLPSATESAVGSAQDANAANTLQGQFDLFNRQNNAGTDLLSRLMAPITGASAAGGSTTVNTQPSTPLWQSLLGLGIAALADGGPVVGPGGPKDDAVPVMASNGEYVLPAEAVAAIGNGDHAAGVQKLNALVGQRAPLGSPANTIMDRGTYDFGMPGPIPYQNTVRDDLLYAQNQAQGMAHPQTDFEPHDRKTRGKRQYRGLAR
jgi:hypothetical protein